MAEPTPTRRPASSTARLYIADFTSRELAGQQLDVTAPGVWIRGPFAGFPGYNHLPWSGTLAARSVVDTIRRSARLREH